MYGVPYVIEKTGRNTKLVDIRSKMLEERKIILDSDVDEQSTNSVIQQLLWLNSVSDEDIELYIKSPGGSVTDGLAVKDVIDSIACKVNTIGMGCCASMGAYLLSCGTGVRRGTKNLRYMIHSVSSGNMGTVHDMRVSMKETDFLQELLMRDIASFSKGKLTYEEIEKMTQRDFFMSTKEAIEIGLLDEEA